MPTQPSKFAALIPLIVLLQLFPLWAEASSERWFDLMRQSQQDAQGADYPRALPVALKALQEAKKFRPDDARYTESLRCVSWLYLQLGQYKQAEPYFKEESKILAALGEDFPDLDYDYFGLGILCERRGELELAEDYQRKALRLGCSLIKKDEPPVTEIACHLAATLYLRGKDAEAEEVLKSISAFTWATYTRPKDVLDLLQRTRYEIAHERIDLEQENNQLSFVYYRALRKLFVFELRECARRYGQVSIAYCPVLRELAGVLRSQGETAEAYQLDEEALSLLDQLAVRVPAANRDLVALLRAGAESSIADGCCSKKDYARAERLMIHAIETMDKTKESLIVTDFTAQLCRCAQLSGHHQLAVGVVEEALHKYDWITPDYRAEMQRWLGMLVWSEAELKAKEHKPAEAILLKREAVRRLAASRNHSSDYDDHALALAQSYLQTKNYAAAEALLKEFLAYAPSERFQHQAWSAAAELNQIYFATGRSRQAVQIWHRYCHVLDDSYVSNRNRLERQLAAEPSAAQKNNLRSSLADLEGQYASDLYEQKRFTETLVVSRLAQENLQLSEGKTLRFYKQPLMSGCALSKLKNYLKAEEAFKIVVRVFSSGGVVWRYILESARNELKEAQFSQATADQKTICLGSQVLNDGLRRVAIGIESACDDSEDRLLKQATQTYERGQFDQSARLVEKLLDLHEQFYGHDSMAVKDNLSSLAWTLAGAERFPEAEKAAQQYLALPEIREGYNNLHIRHLLIDIYNRTGRYGEAEKACRELLADRSLPRKDYVWSLYQLGVTNTLQGRADLAEPLYKKARLFCITPFSLDGFSSHLLNTLSPLHQQHLADEAHLCEEELSVYQKDDGKETNGKQGLHCLLSELANVYTCQKQFDKALPLYNQVLAIYSKGDSFPLDTHLVFLRNYQRFLRLTNKFNEATALNPLINQLMHQRQ